MPVDLDAPNRAAMRLFGDQAQKGQKWTYFPQNGQPFDINGIYDEAWNSIGIQNLGRAGIAPVSTTQPAFWLRIADLTGGFRPKQRDRLRQNATGQSFQISDTLPDSMGGIRLLLTKVSG